MITLPRPHVLIVFGGCSSEHEISRSAAAGILAAIDRTKWDVIPLGTTRDGQWMRVADDPSVLESKDGKDQCVTARSTRVALTPGEGNLVELSYDDDPGVPDSRVAGAEDLGHVGIVFPLLHGLYGEDGIIQGLFEMASMRYAGCGVTSLAVLMDKYLTKTVLTAAGTDVDRWELVTVRQWDTDATACMDRIEGPGFPVFVKSYRVGSSVGISCVACRKDLPMVIKETANHDPYTIVEVSTPDREVECDVLDSHSNWCSGIAPLGKIVTPEGKFYDYEHKYVGDIVGLSYPADVAPGYADRTCAIAWHAFGALGCGGLARADSFLDEITDSVIINEMNIMPGFTPISMYPQTWAASGLSYSDLLNELLTEAGERPFGLC